MIDFTIKLADKIVAVSAIYDSTKEYCKDYLFEGESDFSVEIRPNDIEFEREQCIKTDEKEGTNIRNFSDSYLEIIAVQRKITEALFEYDTVLFHGSVIAVDGAAYLFTAKSGTGKSTHTRLWREMLGERAIMVNDDKPFISINEGGGVTVHGSPWNGKHRLGENIAVPLRAICILERGDVNKIERIPASRALKMLIQQSSRPSNPALMGKYMELIDGISRGVEFYRLECNMELEAAKVAYEAMSGMKLERDKF
jgi:hypothetical protein